MLYIIVIDEIVDRYFASIVQILDQSLINDIIIIE